MVLAPCVLFCFQIVLCAGFCIASQSFSRLALLGVISIHWLCIFVPTISACRPAEMTCAHDAHFLRLFAEAMLFEENRSCYGTSESYGGFSLFQAPRGAKVWLSLDAQAVSRAVQIICVPCNVQIRLGCLLAQGTACRAHVCMLI